MFIPKGTSTPLVIPSWVFMTIWSFCWAPKLSLDVWLLKTAKVMRNAMDKWLIHGPNCTCMFNSFGQERIMRKNARRDNEKERKRGGAWHDHAFNWNCVLTHASIVTKFSTCISKQRSRKTELWLVQPRYEAIPTPTWLESHLETSKKLLKRQKEPSFYCPFAYLTLSWRSRTDLRLETLKRVTVDARRQPLAW